MEYCRWYYLNLIKPSAPWMGRYWHTVAWFDNNIWVMGGITAGIELNDVWYSPDGINWRGIKNHNRQFTGRAHVTRNLQQYLIMHFGICVISMNNVWKLRLNLMKWQSPELAETTRLLISPNPTTNKCLTNLMKAISGEITLLLIRW
ncbi:MAG: hypothetical protein IPL12_10360 [Bacteroidetes bacterium]|nr:hypothetical protein [Bacteroidota bacterium]